MRLVRTARPGQWGGSCGRDGCGRLLAVFDLRFGVELRGGVRGPDGVWRGLERPVLVERDVLDERRRARRARPTTPDPRTQDGAWLAEPFNDALGGAVTHIPLPDLRRTPHRFECDAKHVSQ